MKMRGENDEDRLKMPKARGFQLFSAVLDAFRMAGIFDGTQLHRLIGQQILKQRRDEEHQSSGLGQSSGSGHEKELQQRRAHSMDSLKDADRGLTRCISMLFTV